MAVVGARGIMSGPDDDLLPQWLESTCDSTRDVLDTLGAIVQTAEDGWQLPDNRSGAYVSIDTENHSYLLALVSPPELQAKLIVDQLGWAERQDAEALRDAMGEITNMIAGATKTSMTDTLGTDLTLGLPMFLRGEFMGTSAARTRTTSRRVTILDEHCLIVVIEQQATGEAVRRRQVERQLRDSEERTRAIIEAAPDAVITCTKGGIVQTFNSAAERDFGYRSDEIVGRDAAELLNLGEPLETLSGRQKISTGKRSDGAEFPVEVSVSTFQFRETENYALIARDITQREEARQELETINKRMVELSHAAGKAEVASDVLHNIGNVLNSVNTATTLLLEREKASRIGQLRKMITLLDSKESELPQFFESDPKAKKVLPFFHLINDHLCTQREQNLSELEQVLKHVDHIKRVVMTQQLIASAAGVSEEFRIHELATDALTHIRPLIEGSNIQVEQNFLFQEEIVSDKNKVMQIVINLIKNACEAIGEFAPEAPKLILETRSDDDLLILDVVDNGMGISPDAMTKLFSHGFTTKKDGHGFGLHGCSLYAKQLGGELKVSSDGEGLGCRFSLRLPNTPPGDQALTAQASMIPSRPLDPRRAKL